MNRHTQQSLGGILLISSLFSVSMRGHANTLPEWKTTQDLRVSRPGLAKARLPIETLGAAQPTLTDLRLLDGGGHEVPFLIDQPSPEPARDVPLDRMTMTMEKKKTIITGVVPEVLRATGFEAITLFTSTDDFLKPLSIEASVDGKKWTMLLHQAPIFKQTGDAASSIVNFPQGHWAFLRITLDDSESAPLRISAVRLFAPGRPNRDLQEFEPQILETASDAHRTEIRILLPAEGLPVESLRLEVPDTTFRRQVRLTMRQFSGGEFQEVPVQQGSIYRLSLGAQKAEELVFPIRQTMRGTLATVTIENGDSPALTVQHLWVRVVPRDLLFDAPSAGVYQLSAGNPTAPARDYDVASLRDSLRQATFQRVEWGPLQSNPDFKRPEAPVVGNEEGSDIETDPWRFRKKVTTEIVSNPSETPGLYRIELDLAAIAHNEGRLEALRLVRDEKQLPYIVDYAGVERSFAPTFTSLPKAPKGKSQWVLTLPCVGLPITELHFSVPDTLFQRTVTLYEVAPEPVPSEGERVDMSPVAVTEGVVHTVGSLVDLAVSRNPVVQTLDGSGVDSASENAQGKPIRVMGSVLWTRTRADAPNQFNLTLSQTPQTQQLILETDNGDNAPIHPTSVQAYYRAPRLLFRSRPSPSPLYLYYGQPEVAAPQYDLNLIAAELLSTPPQEATLGAEESLKATRWWEVPLPAVGHVRHVFWIVMGLVVAGLLLVIAKLLPESEAL